MTAEEGGVHERRGWGLACREVDFEGRKWAGWGGTAALPDDLSILG